MTKKTHNAFKCCHQFLQSAKLFLLAASFSLTASAANTIIAIVDDNIVTFDAISRQIKADFTKAQKIALVDQQIELILQLKAAHKFNIQPELESINIMLNNIAFKNKLTRAQLKSLAQFNDIVEQIKQELILRGLKQFVLQQIEINLTQAEIDKAVAKNKSINQADAALNNLAMIKAKLIQSQKESYFNSWLKRLRKDAYIEIFEHKL